MGRRKRDIKHASQGEKDIWHRLDLQNLKDDKFVYVANQILKGRFTLLTLKASPIIQSE